ncbi:MAG TPA: TMEM165/GDT1 family protein [Rhizomicrobium sp.]|jgi:putative Ca2+/H+ antiporter (TMEM165/GDT1 family)|nr:TMEM165/GDT1 family protein [Rhizomicrobium sp.]
MLSLPVILSTFGIIFIAELPDKTALAALILATKYKARDVILGTWLAFLVQTIVAVAAGRLLTYLPPTPIHIASGIGFLIFAVLALRRKEDEDESDEARAVAQRASTRPIWLVSFLVIFAAEWGDLTQLATAALVARGGDPWSIGIGAVLGLWAVTVVAAFAGQRLGKLLKPRLLNIVSGILFGLIGLYIIAAALWPFLAKA